MINTPEAYPDHHVIGQYFKGVGLDKSEIYWCDSYDTDLGYWLTSLTVEGRRINISERAVDATFHTVWLFGPDRPDSFYCRWGRLQPEEVALIKAHIAERGVTPSSLRA